MRRFPPTIPRRSRLLYGLLGILTFFALWWVLTFPFFTEMVTDRVSTDRPEGGLEYTERTYEVRRAFVNPPGLETPGNTFRRAFEVNLPQHLFRSTMRILLGFLLSISLAVPLGIAMGLFPRLHAFVNPVVSLMRPIPSIAWVPLVAIWFGVDEFQKLVIVFMGSFAAALIYTIEATVKVEPNLIRAARNLGASRGQVLRRVLLPAALPNILSGLKVVFAICWTCVISAEIVGTQEGLGALVWNSKEVSDTSAALVGIASIGIIVLLLDAVIGVLERMLVPWMYANRESS